MKIIFRTCIFYCPQKCESETEDDEPATAAIKEEIKEENDPDANSSLNITTAHSEDK